MRRRLSIIALALALAVAAPIHALPAEGDDSTGGSGNGDSDSGSGSTDPIKVTTDLIDQTTDGIIVANTNIATGAANTMGGTEELSKAAATLQEQLQDGALPKLSNPTADQVEDAAAAPVDVAKTVKDLITNTGTLAPEDLLKKIEGFSVKLDPLGCYDILGPNDLSLKLCEDDGGARKPILSEATNTAVSWVNGTVTNTGTNPLCRFAFASPSTDLVNDALEMVPNNLPVTLPNAKPQTTIDLAPGEKIDYAFLLPFDTTTNTPSFVGFTDTLAVCLHATKKLGPPLQVPPEEAAGNANAAAQAAQAAVAEVAQGAGVALERVDNVNAAAAEGAGVYAMGHEGMEVQQAGTTSPAASRSLSLAAGLVAVGASALAFVLA